MNASLILLALRRTWHRGLVIAALALALLLVDRERSMAWSGLAEEDVALASDGLARAEVWSAFALLLAPALLLLAARTTSRWRAGEAEWLGPRRAGTWSALLSTWFGVAAGSSGLLLIAFAAGELAAPGRGGSFRAAGELAADIARPTEGGSGLRWTVPDPGSRAPADSRARVEIDVLPRAGTAAEVLLRARRVGPGAAAGGREARRRMARAGWIEVELPPGPGDLELSLERAGEDEGAAIAIERPAAILLAPAGGARGAGMQLLMHFALALGAGVALALGLGTWIGAGLAVALMLAGWTAATLAPEDPPHWFPGAGLPEVLACARDGLVPALPGVEAVAGAVIAAFAGLALARAGLRTWRGPA